MIDILKKLRQDLGLCGHSFVRYSEKCFTQTPRWFPLVGHQYGGCKLTETSQSLTFAIETKSYYSRTPVAVNACSRARTIYLAKT